MLPLIEWHCIQQKDIIIDLEQLFSATVAYQYQLVTSDLY